MCTNLISCGGDKMFIESIECSKFLVIADFRNDVYKFIRERIEGNYDHEMYVLVYLLEQEKSSKLSFYVTAYPELVVGKGEKLMQDIISDYIAALAYT